MKYNNILKILGIGLFSISSLNALTISDSVETVSNSIISTNQDNNNVIFKDFYIVNDKFLNTNNLDNYKSIKTQIVNKPFNIKLVSTTNLDGNYYFPKLIKVDLINNDNGQILKSVLFMLPDKKLNNNIIELPFIYNNAVKNAKFVISYINTPNLNPQNINDLLSTVKEGSCVNSCSYNFQLQNGCLNIEEKATSYLDKTIDINSFSNIDICNPNIELTKYDVINNFSNVFQLQNKRILGKNDCLNCIITNNKNLKTIESDNFSIRPAGYIILPSETKIKSNEELNGVKIIAVDNYGFIVDNYNENSDNLILDITDDKESLTNFNKGNLIYDKFNFNNGMTKINNIKYSEIGNIKLQLKEKIPFANIDKNEDTTEELIIPVSKTDSISVIPYKFITKITLTNNDNKNTTYLSNEGNTGNIKLEIQSVNKDGEITKNFSKDLYSKDVSINLKLNNLPIKNYYLNNIKYLNKDNIELKIKKEDFINGQNSNNNSINFEKDYSNPIKPFNLDIKSVETKDEDITTLIDNPNVEGNIKFVFGKLLAQNQIIKGNDFNFVTKIGYYGENNSWIVDKERTLNLIGNSSFISPAYLIINQSDIKSGEEVQQITYNGNYYPQTVTYHLSIPEFLWTSNYNLNYNDPNNGTNDNGTNDNCNVHPCISFTFIKDTAVSNNENSSTNDSNGKWISIKSNKNTKNANNGTVNIESSEKVYNRIN